MYDAEYDHLLLHLHVALAQVEHLDVRVLIDLVHGVARRPSRLQEGAS